MSATSRPAAAVAAEVRAHLPPGWIWPRVEGSTLTALLDPLVLGLAGHEQMAAEALMEVDPREASLCLVDYERVLGADPCGRDPGAMPLSERRLFAWQRWTARGGQSPAYYIDLAAKRGVAIAIREFRVSAAGVMAAGDELVPEGEQFTWEVHLPFSRGVVFTAGTSTSGELLYDIVLTGIECDLNRLKPAHTELAFVYGA
jgi:uncharacterized protein YmfQ (DUF2313 family)